MATECRGLRALFEAHGLQKYYEKAAQIAEEQEAEHVGDLLLLEPEDFEHKIMEGMPKIPKLKFEKAMALIRAGDCNVETSETPPTITTVSPQVSSLVAAAAPPPAQPQSEPQGVSTPSRIDGPPASAVDSDSDDEPGPAELLPPRKRKVPKSLFIFSFIMMSVVCATATCCLIQKASNFYLKLTPPVIQLLIPFICAVIPWGTLVGNTDKTSDRTARVPTMGGMLMYLLFLVFPFLCYIVCFVEGTIARQVGQQKAVLLWAAHAMLPGIRDAFYCCFIPAGGQHASTDTTSKIREATESDAQARPER